MAVVGGSLDQMLGSQSLSNLLGQDKMTPALFRPPAAKPTRLEQAQETLTGIEQKLGETQKQIGEFEAQKQARQAEEEAKRAAKGAELARKEREEIEASPVVQESQRIALEAAQARFEPSQRNATENAALFSLIGAIGFAIGAGGKKNAMQAMAAMNGMVEGVRKGDMERYTREKSTFETNLNALYRSSQLLATEAKRAVDLASRNKEQARLDFESVLAQEGADFVKQYYQKFGLVGTQKLLEQQAKGAQRMVENAQKAQDKEESDKREATRKLDEQRTRLQDREYLTRLAASLRPEKAPAAGIKPSAKIQEGYIANSVLIQDLDSLTEQLKNPKIAEGLKKYRIEAFLTEEGKVLNQVLEQQIPPEIRKFLTEVRDIRNNYYLDKSGKAVTGAEALRNYGTVPQPGDTPEVMVDKISGMRKRVKRVSDIQKRLYGLPDLSDVQLQGMKNIITPGETYPVTTDQTAGQPAAPDVAKPTHTLRGRPIIVRDGKWVFQDTGEEAK